jgi:nucleotide-binding universal stress UspA family protein
MKRILAALDGSPLAETILPFVEGLALKTRAAVTLLHVSSLPEHAAKQRHPALDRLVQRQTELAREYLCEQQRRLSAAGVDVGVETVVGDPAREIVACAERAAVDLIALATHGRSGIGRLAYGSVAERTLLTTTRPLLLIRPDGWAAAPRTLQRIVVPLDLSPEAEGGLAVGARLAEQLALPLVLVHFVEPLLAPFVPETGSAAYLDVQAIIDSSIAQSQAYMEKTTAALRTRGLDATGEVSVAHAADGIALYARQHPGSLVVLSTHGRSGWRRFVLGSVAHRVVHTIAGAVVVCPPSQQSETPR